MYSIKPQQIERAKKLGLTIKPSTRGYFKVDVFKDGEYVTSIGHKKYKDYAIYLEEKGKAYADERKRLYHLRHRNDGTRGQLASLILWT
jgi:glutamyl/glutaminyl-tRNA synthetase